MPYYFYRCTVCWDDVVVNAHPTKDLVCTCGKARYHHATGAKPRMQDRPRNWDFRPCRARGAGG